MSADEVLPWLTREWRPTSAIARDVWEARGRRTTWPSARSSVTASLRRLAEDGIAERRGEARPFREVEWRLAQ